MHNLTVPQLVEQFRMIALDQYEALLTDEYAKYNRLYDRIKVLEQELKTRVGDGRRALFPLLSDPNPRVRIKAAFATLAVAPDRARRALQAIIERQEYPEAADARLMLRSLERGTFHSHLGRLR